MDREIVLAVLTVAVCAPLGAACGWWPGSQVSRADERASWRGLWLPLLPVAVALAALLGWTVTEPEHAETVPWPWLLPAGFGAMVWLRATVRAVVAFRQTAGDVPAATIGMLRPRVVISAGLADALDAEALQAVREHERAHARHRDPLRIWLAQFATDLQWPAPAARARFKTWLSALEIARDDEARAHGIDGADLAAGIVAAARMGHPNAGAAGATLVGAEGALRERVARLLSSEPAPVDRDNRRGVIGATLVGALLLVAITAGVAYGEPVVRLLLGASP